MHDSSPMSSKLLIRSEVLAVVMFLSVVEAPSQQDRQKQIRRLAVIPDRLAVLEVLVREMGRTQQSAVLQALSELLMELGSLEKLQEPLWEIIRQPQTRDEVKDAANLILRHLGDNADPDLYLEYLDDPQGLINRETERMLEVASRVPEALIDFIDFIVSLPVSEQLNLIQSLQGDYVVDHLLNLYIPMLLAGPTPELEEAMLRYMGTSRSPRAAAFLTEFSHHLPVGQPRAKWVKLALTALRLSGIALTDAPACDAPHPLLSATQPDACFITLSDGLGNQGVMATRRHPNGDICLMSVAINDQHGIIDCFGFYQLSEADFLKICEKFYEDAQKLPLSPAFCRQKLDAAMATSRRLKRRIPYEYVCWRVLIDDFPTEPVDPLAFCRAWARPERAPQTGALYQHPDFHTWFLEEGDHPIVTDLLAHVGDEVRTAIGSPAGVVSGPAAFMATLDQCALALVMALTATDWREWMSHRLAEAAYLLHTHPDNALWAELAATEAVKLSAVQAADTERALSVGFTRQFGRRCVEESLLRLREAPDAPPGLAPLVNAVIQAWNADSYQF